MVLLVSVMYVPFSDAVTGELLSALIALASAAAIVLGVEVCPYAAESMWPLTVNRNGSRIVGQNSIDIEILLIPVQCDNPAGTCCIARPWARLIHLD